MKCESCGNPRMLVLEPRKAWFCPKCGSLWTVKE